MARQVGDDRPEPAAEAGEACPRQAAAAEPVEQEDRRPVAGDADRPRHAVDDEADPLAHGRPSSRPAGEPGEGGLHVRGNLAVELHVARPVGPQLQHPDARHADGRLDRRAQVGGPDHPVLSPERRDERPELDPVRRAEQLLEVGREPGVRAVGVRLRQEREDPAAVVVHHHDGQRQPVQSFTSSQGAAWKSLL